MSLGERFERQAKLLEVGASGQAKILAATFRLPSQAGAGVAREYLVRAGAANVEICAELARTPLPHVTSFGSAAARDYASGALLALVELRRTLGMTA